MGEQTLIKGVLDGIDVPVNIKRIRITAAQRDWLKRGLNQPGGKLPIFDKDGQRYSPRTIRSCIEQGWAEPWFENPTKPDWLICKLTNAGRDMAAKKSSY